MSPLLSDEAARLAALWNFHPNEQLESGWCSHVFADETRVLKVPWRGEELTTGLQASLALQGWFGPRIFESDPATGIALMERVLPGFDLTNSVASDLERMKIVADLIKVLQGASVEGNWIGLDEYHTLDHPLKWYLLETSENQVFLHGDLHHFNLLWSEVQHVWIPIDPKGLMGEKCYEALAYLRNEIEVRDSVDFVRDLIKRRLRYFSERLDFDPVRTAAWGWVDQIDSGPDANLVLAEVYKEIVLDSGLVEAGLFEEAIELSASPHVDGDSD